MRSFFKVDYDKVKVGCTGDYYRTWNWANPPLSLGGANAPSDWYDYDGTHACYRASPYNNGDGYRDCGAAFEWSTSGDVLEFFKPVMILQIVD